MDFIRELLPFCSCLPCLKKPSRYGYSVIRAPRDNSNVSLLSHISLDRPIPPENLELIEDHQDEIIQCLSDLKSSQILIQIPSLGRNLTSQLAELNFEDEDNEMRSENERNLKGNLVYLAAYTKNVDKLINELFVRRLLMYSDVLAITPQPCTILKALEVYKRVLKQPDSLGFIIGSLKITGSDYVAEILIGSFPLSSTTELICRISLTPGFSPEFKLEGQPGKYRRLRKIPHERQEILTSVNGSYLEIKAKTLLRSLEYSQQLTTIKLTNIRLYKDFQWKVYLPHLKEFTLHTNDSFSVKKEFYDYITPQKIHSLLFFKTDENNNHRNPLDFIDSNTIQDWDVNQIWRMNVDISLKIGGRTVLMIDHARAQLFSRMENNYKIPENIIQPAQVKCLYLGWCRIARSSIPLHVTRLHLYSVQLVDALKDRTYLCSLLTNLLNLREFKYWGNVGRQPWPILKTSLFPKKLKSIAASFVEICPDQFLSHLESICLYIYHVPRESELTFLTHFLQSSKRVTLVNFPPYQRPTQEQLLALMRNGCGRQILFACCKHDLNFEKHFLYFRHEIFNEIQGSQLLLFTNENRLWKARALSVLEVARHLYLKFGFEAVYTFEAFCQHEILTSLWKSYSDV